MSLSDCLKKIAINQTDKKSILASLDAVKTDGMSPEQISIAENKAVNDYLSSAEKALDGIAKTVEESGGSVAKSDSVSGDNIVSETIDKKGRKKVVSRKSKMTNVEGVDIEEVSYIVKRDEKTSSGTGKSLTRDEFFNEFDLDDAFSDESILDGFDKIIIVSEKIPQSESRFGHVLEVILVDSDGVRETATIIVKSKKSLNNLKQSQKVQPWEMSSQEYNKVEDKKEREIFTVEVGSRKIEVMRNPSDQDLKSMLKEISDSGKGEGGQPRVRFTYDSDGNVYRWPAIDAIHAHMEPILEKREGVKLDQNADKKTSHRMVVRRALYNGESVPDNVLAEYPDVIDEVKGIAGNKVALYQSQDGDGKSFSSWSGINIDEVVDSIDINDHDFTEEKPYVVKVFHGTTHEFNTFEDTTGNKEGQFGAVNYFTSSEYDAEENYAGEGADLTSRIEQRSERLEDELGEYDVEDIIMLSEKHGIEFDQENDAYPEELPKAIAREELSGGGGKVMEVFVKTEKPFVIGDSKIIEFREEVDEADVLQLVADNNDISLDELNDSVDNYEDEIADARSELQYEVEDDLTEAVQKVAFDNEVDATELLSELYEVLEGTTGGELEKLMRESESFAYAEDPETGDSIGFHLIGEVIQELGYDSIILKNADSRFMNMSMNSGTTHIHVFHADNTNIKSVDNETFDKNDANIFKQDESEGDRGSFVPKGVLPGIEQSIINLYKTSDASTFIHESAHLFLDMEARYAVTVDKLDADQQTILDFLGLDSFSELILDGKTVTDKQREAHEKWAETFEVYMREGKAPSLDLKEAFMAFKSWLMRLYETLTDSRLSRASLNPEIREVFDRLLASEAEIEQATSNPEYDQLFKSKEQAGMTDKEWSDYQDKVTKAKNRSQSTLDEKLMKELYRRKTKEWNEEKAPLIQEELDKLKDSPAFKLKEAVDEAPMDRDITREALNLSKKLSTKERMAENKLIDLENDSLLIVATKSGGLDFDDFVTHNVDPAVLEKKKKGEKQAFNNKQVFGMATFKKKGGMNLGGLTEVARDNGFRNSDGTELDDNQVLDILLLEINQGEKSYSVQGGEARSEAEYREQNGEGEVEVPALERFIPKVTKAGGVDPYHYQNEFGFNNIEEMFSALIDAKNIKAKARANAEQRMVDKYGDILNDGTIELEVRESVHNSEQAKLLLAELRALDKKAPLINRELMKSQAKEVISTMKFGEIKPSKYYLAEVRHAKKTISDPDNAWTHKLQQLANHYLYREAVDAKARMERQRKYIRGMQTRVYPHTVVDEKYSSNMKMLANAYEMKKGNARKNTDVDAVLNWMITQIDDANDLIDFDVYDLALIQAINNKKDGIQEPFELPTFDDMTSSELRGLYDQLKHMRFLGGKLANEKRGDLKEKREKIAKSIEKHGGDKKPFSHEEDNYARKKNDAKEIIHSHRRIGGILETMDNFEDGILAEEYRVITEATNNQLELTSNMAESMDEAFGDILELINKRRSTTITKQDGRLFKLTNRGRFTLGLNWGNEGNRSELLRGLNNKANDEYTEADVIKMLSGMSDKEILALDKIWKAKEALWPKMSEVEVRLKGVAPPKIEPSPFKINGIQLGGGHYRLHYRKDPDDSARKKDSLDQVALGKVKLKTASSLNERVGSGGRQVDLELSHLFQDISEDIHYIAFAEMSERMNATFKGVSNPVVSSIIDHYGQPYYDNLITSISAIVQPDEGAEGVFKYLKWVRSNLTYGYLAFSVRNVLQQPIAITNSFSQIGVGYTMKGALKFFSNPSAFKEQIKSVSPFMKNRTSLVNREAREQLTKIDALHPKLGAMKNMAFAPQTFVDSLIAYPTWLGAKEKYLSENPNADEKRANLYADEMVAKTIGSGLSKDVGAILNKGEGWKQLTFMGTFFNLTWNLHVENAQLLKRGKISGMEYARRLGWMAIAPAILTMFLLDDVPEDDDEMIVHALKEVGHYNLSSLFLLRDISNAVIKGFDSSIPGLKFATGAKRVSGDMKGLISGDEDLDAEMVASLLRGLQPLVPLPGSGQVARTLEGLSDPKQDAWGTLVEGKERN